MADGWVAVSDGGNCRPRKGVEANDPACSRRNPISRFVAVDIMIEILNLVGSDIEMMQLYFTLLCSRISLRWDHSLTDDEFYMISYDGKVLNDINLEASKLLKGRYCYAMVNHPHRSDLKGLLVSLGHARNAILPALS